MRKLIRKLRDSGGVRTSVNLCPDMVKAIEVIRDTQDLRTVTAAVRWALIEMARVISDSMRFHNAPLAVIGGRVVMSIDQDDSCDPGAAATSLRGMSRRAVEARTSVNFSPEMVQAIATIQGTQCLRTKTDAIRWALIEMAGVIAESKRRRNAPLAVIGGRVVMLVGDHMPEMSHSHTAAANQSPSAVAA